MRILLQTLSYNISIFIDWNGFYDWILFDFIGFFPRTRFFPRLNFILYIFCSSFIKICITPTAKMYDIDANAIFVQIEWFVEQTSDQ